MTKSVKKESSLALGSSHFLNPHQVYTSDILKQFHGLTSSPFCLSSSLLLLSATNYTHTGPISTRLVIELPHQIFIFPGGKKFPDLKNTLILGLQLHFTSEKNKVQRPHLHKASQGFSSLEGKKGISMLSKCGLIQVFLGPMFCCSRCFINIKGY